MRIGGWASVLVAAGLALAPATAASAAAPHPARSSVAGGQDAGHPAVRAGACPDASGVTVVVDSSALGGGVRVSCAAGLTAASRGSDALDAAGISWESPATQPGFVCRIDGRPGVDESIGGYHEACVDTPPATAYWSYWKSSGDGTWAYSTAGVSSGRVRLGGFEGWSFSTGAQVPPSYDPVRSTPEQQSPPPPAPAAEPAAPPATPTQGDAPAAPELPDQAQPSQQAEPPQQAPVPSPDGTGSDGSSPSTAQPAAPASETSISEPAPSSPGTTSPPASATPGATSASESASVAAVAARSSAVQPAAAESPADTSWVATAVAVVLVTALGVAGVLLTLRRRHE